MTKSQMPQTKRPQPKTKVVNLKDKLSSDDLAKIQEYQFDTTSTIPVDREWMILAEWLKIAGYQAYLDARNDARDENGNLIITTQEILTLIEATRKLEALDHYRNAEAAFIGAGSAQTKKPSAAFKSLTKNILNKIKVQE